MTEFIDGNLLAWRVYNIGQGKRIVVDKDKGHRVKILSYVLRFIVGKIWGRSS